MAITKYSEKARFYLDSSNYGSSLPDVRIIRRGPAFTPQGEAYPSVETKYRLDDIDQGHVGLRACRNIRRVYSPYFDNK